MRVNKGINKDIREQDMPEGMSTDARNIVYDKTGSITNEKGFDLFVQNINKTVIGIVNHSDGTSVIFFLNDDGSSEIGIMTEKNKYQVKVKDTSALPLFNFNKDYPITGELEKNALGEIVVAWTGTNGDEALDVPRIINLENLPFEVNASMEILEPEKFGQTQLFLDVLIPEVDLVEVKDTGGSLLTGAYYMTLKYLTSDGSTTSSVPLTNPIYVNDESKGLFPEYDGAVGGTDTNKSISLSISGLDTNYEKVQIGVLKVINGVTSAAFNDIEIAIREPLNFVYTGKDSETSVPPSEILVGPTVYTGVHTMTQLNRRLYIGNLKTATPLDFQKYANNINLSWTTKNVGMDSVKDSYKNEVVSFYDKSFMPDEIYAFYIYFYLKSGGLSPAYHIPGRASTPADIAITTDTSVLRVGGAGTRKFEFEDTSTANGDFGYHENSLEVYPNVPEFNGTSLEGQKVRHHKFPSLRTLAERDGNLGDVPDVNAEIEKITFTIQGYEGEKTGSTYLSPGAYVGNGTHYNIEVLFGATSVPSSIGYISYFGDTTFNNRKRREITITKSCLINLNLSWNFRLRGFSPYVTTILGVVTPLAGIIIKTPIIDKAEYYFRVYIQKPNGDIIYLINDEENLIISPDTVGDTFGGQGDGSVAMFGSAIDVGKSGSIDTSIYLEAGDILGVDSRTRVEYRNLVGGLSPFAVIQDDYTSSSRTGTSNIQFVFPEPDPITGELPDSKYKLPVLGFNASNIVIPSEIQDKIQGYGFAYATRDLQNLTVLGQSLLVPKDLDRDLDLDETTRFHAFEMMKERPNPSPDYILPSIVYNSSNGGYGTLPVGSPTVLKVDENVNSTYVPTNNTVVDNENREEHIRTKLDLENNLNGLEGNVIVDYKLVNSNIYAPFTSANLTLIGKIIRLEDHTGDVTDIYGGDTYRELYGTRLFSGTNINKIYLPSVFSKFHIGMRHEGEGTFEKYFPKSNIPFEFGSDTGFWDDYSDYIGYNRDYDASNNLTALLPDDYKPKPVRFPYRVARSVIVPKEETELLWRVFLALDYYEMPRNRGVVWNLQGFNETNLLIHCTEMLYTTYSNEVLKQGEVAVVLGSGDIFSRPPREIHTSDKGYAGTTSQFSAHINKVGYTFIDEKRGKVFILRVNQGLQLTEISAQGLKDWYRDNLAIEDNFVIRDDNPYNGRGYTMQLDEEENRLLVTKIDGDNSFTRSYDIDSSRWVSFHDYKPNYYFFLNNNIYTLGESSFYKMNSSDKRGVYFPSLQPLEEDGITIKPFESYIDIVFNTGSSYNKVFYSFSWVSDVLDTNDFPLFNDTISTIWTYNNYQSSIVFDVARLRNARRTGGRWTFNEMLDIVSKDSRNNFQNFLKKTTEHVDLDDTKVNNNMSWFKKKRFIHNYITVRFTFNNKDNKKLALHEVFANTRNNQLR